MSNAKQEAKKPKRSWRRRLLRWAVILLVLAVVLRIAMPFAVSPVANQVAGMFDLSMTIDDFEISILRGSVKVWGVRVAAVADEGEEQPQPYVEVEFAEFDLDVSALLAFDLHVRRIEADGIDLFIERTADGKIPLLRHLPRPADEVEEDEGDEEEEPEELSAIDLTLPLRVDALRAQHVRVHYVDAWVRPEVDSWVDSSVRISGLGRTDQPALIQIHAHAEDLLDGATFSAQTRMEGRNAEFSFVVDVRGVNPSAVPGWLGELGLEPRVERLDIHTAGSLQITPHPSDELAITAEFDMEPVRVLVEGEEHVRVEDFRIDAPLVRPDRVHVASVAVTDVLAKLRRPAPEIVSAMGLFIGTVSPPLRTAIAEEFDSSADAGQPEVLGQLLAAALRLDRLLLLDWRFDELKLADATLRLQDEVTGKDLDLTCREAAMRELIFGPNAGSDPVELSVLATAPTVADKIRVDGKLWPTTTPRRIELNFEAKRIEGDGLDPYLGMLGLASDLDSAAVNGSATLMFTRDDDSAVLNLEVGDIAYIDGEQQLAALQRFRLMAGLYDEEGATRARIERLTVEGGSLPLRRDAEGELHALGFKTVPRVPKPAATKVIDNPAGDEVAVSAPPMASTGSAEPPPRIEIGEVRWSALQLSWLDEAVAGGVRLDPIAVDGSLTNLAIGGDAERYEASTAALEAVLRPGGLAEALIAKGSIQSKPGAVDLAVNAELRGQAISWAPLAPYLAPAGLASALDAGEMRGEVQAELLIQDAVTTVDFGLTGFELTDGESPLVSLDGFAVDGVELSEDGLRVKSVVVDRPVLHVARIAEQSFRSLGLVFDPDTIPPGKTPAATAEAPIEQATPAVPLRLPELPRVTIERIELRDAGLGMHNQIGGQPLASELIAHATIANLTTVPGAGPTTLEASAGNVDFMDGATVSGQLEILESSIEAFGRCDATGLRPGVLASYLPRGITLQLEDGQASAGLSLSISEAAQGGLSVDFKAADVALRDGGQVLAGVDEIRIHAPRIDPTGGVITIADTRVTGAELQITRSGKMAFEAAGIGIDLEAMGGASAPVEPETEDEEQPPVALGSPASAKATIPTVRLEHFELELARLGFVDLSGETPSEPIELKARLFLPEPNVLLDADPEALPHWRFQLAGALDPLVGSIAGELGIAPWQPWVHAEGALRVTGIQGEKLSAIAPELEQLLAGSDFQGGSFDAEFESVLRLRRKNPLDFDLARGFGLGFEIRDMALRAVPEGEILLGLDRLTIDAKRIHPEAGLHFASIEVETPRLKILRDDQGIHAAGLIVPDPLAGVIGGEAPPAIEQPAEDAAPVEPPVEEVAQADPAEKKSPFAGMPEIRVDQLLVQGIDFELRDEVVDPPYRVPVTGLDVEVARVSTKGLDEGRPLKFTTLVQGGEVELPVRGGEAGELERRPVFIETAMHGRVAIHPALDGQVRTALEGLELSTFRGAAAAMGFELHDGVMDAGIELRFEGERGINTRAEFTFANLDVAEGDNGPVASTLGLPVPLSTALFVMKDSNEEISLPIQVRVEGEGVGTGDIVSAATAAAAAVIATAIAESPLRVVGGVGGMFGFGGEATDPSADAREIAFADGSASVPRGSEETLHFLVERLLDDDELVLELRHSFGTADLARAALLGNPDSDQAQALVTRLRRERDELIRRRAELTAEVRVAFAVGNQGEIEPIQRDLRRMLRQLSGTEDALDRVLEFTRPNAPRREDRRTRASAIGMARQRLETLRLALLDIGGPELEGRLEVRRPSFTIDETQPLGTVLLTPKTRKQR